MSTSGISFTGLGSSMDTDSIVKALMAVKQQPLNQMKAAQNVLQQQQTAVNQVMSVVAGLQVAATGLSGIDSFGNVKGSSTDSTVATVTAAAGASAGSHILQVNTLAQAQRVGSKSISSQTTPLGASGQILVNGKAITVSASDTLQTLASNINGANVGVNASIIATGTNAYTLVLASSQTGVANGLKLADVGAGTILQSTLGITTGATTQNTKSGAVVSNLFNDSSSSIGTLLGETTPPAGTVTINGTGVAIDLNQDSLSQIASKINAAGIGGVSASVVATTDPNSGASRQQLQLTGVTTLTDSSNIATNLGLLQNTAATQLAAAKDASFSIDGLPATRSSNTVTDLLSGVTINLLKDTGAPSTEIDVTADTDGIKSQINTFVSAFNQVVSTVSRVASFDTTTNTGGPLFGDVTVQNVVNDLTDMLTNQVPGTSGSITSLADIGITLDQNGALNVDDAKLSDALSGHLSDVAKLFKATGVATDSSITYVSSSAKTVPSTNAGYAVNITAAATQASLLAGTKHTADDNADTEILTFTGAQFGSSGHTIALNTLSTLDGIVSQINADTVLSGALTASNVNGQLSLVGKMYGSAYSFSVVSSQPAAANNSGIGNTLLNANGIDVAGTINGEAATGKGQYLTGNAGNSTTDGLQIRVTSAVTGALGSITFMRGVAEQAKNYGQQTTDFLTGTLQNYANEIGRQISDLTDQMTDMQAGLSIEEEALRNQFAAMDSAVASLKASAASLGGLSTVSSSSSSSSSSTKSS